MVVLNTLIFRIFTLLLERLFLAIFMKNIIGPLKGNVGNHFDTPIIFKVYISPTPLENFLWAYR